ncbi:DsbA family protein [Novispirillum sp. DQ9]|uniref:DsbA family protein n=1 Tax=Novispirillum sp. DQ9 TaxID=3398612 RepID=UPI003C7E84B0
MKLLARLAAAATLLVMAAVPAGAFEPVAVPAAYPERVLGNPDAPITIVEYSALTCSHCANFHTTTLPEVKKAFIDTGKAKIVYRDFPIDNLALGAAVIARCVPEQSYFPMLDMLFKNQATWTKAANPLEALKGYARLAGLNGEQVDACIQNKDLVAAVQEVRNEANKSYGITATPTFVIEGKVLAGAQPYAEFEKVLNGLAGK